MSVLQQVRGGNFTSSRSDLLNMVLKMVVLHASHRKKGTYIHVRRLEKEIYDHILEEPLGAKIFPKGEEIRSEYQSQA